MAGTLLKGSKRQMGLLLFLPYPHSLPPPRRKAPCLSTSPPNYPLTPCVPVLPLVTYQDAAVLAESPRSAAGRAASTYVKASARVESNLPKGRCKS